jgi:hypothetical protein
MGCHARRRIEVSTTAILNERATTHGSFADNARNGQAMRDLFRANPSWAGMHPIHKEALDMIACKVSRILSGQAEFLDHWYDVIGYATLARNTCYPTVQAK